MNELSRIVVSGEVRTAVERGDPVVALESTVLAHGLPRPRNLEVGHLLEMDVRDGGALPATIGVISGMPTIGLASGELGQLATADGVMRLSTRDLPVAVARRADGATTVAATMWLASGCGINVFATGGIGGVHRGSGWDVSSDLAELGRTSMIVVCAGPKAILDVAATREVLQTQGVLVAGWRTDTMPCFYGTCDDLAVDVRVDTATEAAALWCAHGDLGTPGALLLCVPAPAEHVISSEEIEPVIQRALERAESEGVQNKNVTPFLLRAVAEATGGRSLEANVALLRQNARIAAAVATELTC